MLGLPGWWVPGSWGWEFQEGLIFWRLMFSGDGHLGSCGLGSWRLGLLFLELEAGLSGCWGWVSWGLRTVSEDSGTWEGDSY